MESGRERKRKKGGMKERKNERKKKRKKEKKKEKKKDPVGKKLSNSTFTGYPSKHAYTIAYIVIIVLYS